MQNRKIIEQKGTIKVAANFVPIPNMETRRNLRNNLDLHVFFTPAEIAKISRKGQADDVYIVVDVIRATTTLSVMFDRGASRVFAAESVEQAREGARLFPGRLLCGERNALPLPGFDYGNSPSEFSRLDLTGRELILATTNGTRAFYACPEEATRLAGSFYNAEAVTAWALAVAQEQGGNIAIVCAGELGYFAVEDAACAGYLVLELQRQQAGGSQGRPLNLWGSAQAAVSIYEKQGPPDGVAHWHAAQEVIQAGLYDDPGFCVQLSVSTSVPVVVGREEGTGLLLVEKVSSQKLSTARSQRDQGRVAD